MRNIKLCSLKSLKFYTEKEIKTAQTAAFLVILLNQLISVIHSACLKEMVLLCEKCAYLHAGRCDVKVLSDKKWDTDLLKVFLPIELK